MSGMTDIVFLLLIFFMITSTLIHPTALKLLLPQSKHQTSAKPFTSISITENLEYFVEDQPVRLEDLEGILKQRIGENPETYVALHMDRRIAVEHLVEVMNICKNNNYKMILATNPK